MRNPNSLLFFITFNLENINGVICIQLVDKYRNYSTLINSIFYSHMKMVTVTGKKMHTLSLTND